MYKLKLIEIDLEVYLGVHKIEQENLQKVKMNLTLSYHKIPKGCFSDDIKDTICYEKICNALFKKVYHKRFKLIEYLAESLLAELKTIIEPCNNTDIYLELYKKIPLTNAGLARFSVEEICKI